jgi:hypothetical protein
MANTAAGETETSLDIRGLQIRMLLEDLLGSHPGCEKLQDV